MSLESVRTTRLLLALVLPLAVACPGPNPPPVDTTAPTTRAEPRGSSFNAPVSVTLSCSDEGGSNCAATHYTTDGSQPTAASPRYTEPLRFTANTTLRFFSVDGAGNAEAVKTEQYTVDTTPPTVSATPAGGNYREAQTVTLSCSDGAGVGCGPIRYTTDGSTPTASSPVYSAPLTVATTTTLRFFAADPLGNTSAVKTEQYTIDATPPTVSAMPVGGNYRETQTVTLLCSDGAGVGCGSIRYTTDGSTPTASSSVYSAPLTIATTTTLRFFAVDTLGNASAVMTELYVIDRNAPTVSASPAGGAYDATQTVTLSCNDGAGSGCTPIRYTTDGSAPTATSPEYTVPLTVSSNTTLRFFATDRAGNTSTSATESYTIDLVPPTTTAFPRSGVYATAQSVALTCTDNPGGSGCYGTFYTVDATVPDWVSTPYTAPINVNRDMVLRFVSYDNVFRGELFKTETYFIGTSPSSISAQIAAVRNASNGAVSLPIQLALVTYVKPAVEAEPAGFFIQAEQAGPALFVAVNPSTLSPAPAVGDRISFTATQKTTVENRVHVTDLSGYVRRASNHPVDPLQADVNNINLPAVLDDYESEFIDITGTLPSFYAPAAGYITATLRTIGANSSDLLLRLPTALQSQLNLRPNCSVRVRTPLWRSNVQALVTAWRAQDITVLSCP